VAAPLQTRGAVAGLAVVTEDLAAVAEDLAVVAEDLAVVAEDLAAVAEDLAAVAEDLASRNGCFGCILMNSLRKRFIGFDTAKPPLLNGFLGSLNN